MNTLTHRPFRTLVIGDSILWGQGLHEHEKIHTHVVAALREQQPGLRIMIETRAHSGAIIGEPDEPLRTPPLEGPGAGEVPVKQPTLFQQVEAALGKRRRAPSVDLVLISGGVNDVNAAHLINLLDFSLESRIEDVFHRQMKLLLELVCLRFPNAAVIVTGYYPFFSDLSESEIERAAARALGLPNHGLGGAISGLLVDVLTGDELQRRSAVFVEGAHAGIRQTIHELNDRLPNTAGRLLFADPKFGDEHCIAAPESLLFGVNADLSPQDPLADVRGQACAEHAGSIDVLEQVACPLASVGHPNPAGARRYAEAILLQLRYALPALFAE